MPWSSMNLRDQSTVDQFVDRRLGHVCDGDLLPEHHRDDFGGITLTMGNDCREQERQRGQRAIHVVSSPMSCRPFGTGAT